MRLLTGVLRPRETGHETLYGVKSKTCDSVSDHMAHIIEQGEDSNDENTEQRLIGISQFTACG